MGAEVEVVQRGVAVVMGKGRMVRDVVRVVTGNVAIVVMARNELRTSCSTWVCNIEGKCVLDRTDSDLVRLFVLRSLFCFGNLQVGMERLRES